MMYPEPRAQSLPAWSAQLSHDERQTLFTKVRNAGHSARSAMASLLDAEVDQTELLTVAALEDTLSRAIDDLEAARALCRAQGTSA